MARTAHSYTYAQPFTPIFYHGTMAVEPVDASHSKLVYTLIWNQTAVGDAAAQTAAREGRTDALPGGGGQDGGRSERSLDDQFCGRRIRAVKLFGRARSGRCQRRGVSAFAGCRVGAACSLGWKVSGTGSGAWAAAG